MFRIPELSLMRCKQADEFLSLYEQHGLRLTNHWLGRKIVVRKASLLYRQGFLNDAKLLSLFEKAITSGAKASCVWQLYREFRESELYLTRRESSGIAWKHLRGLEKPSSWFYRVYHTVTNVARMTFRNMGYYFGFDPRYLFASKSFWDLEQRYNSLKNLAGLLVTASLGAYQAVHLSSSFLSVLPLQGMLWAQVLVIASIATISILGLGWLFARLGKWLGGAPVEVWKCQNLTFEMSKVNHPVSLGREKELSQLMSFFGSESSSIVMVRGQAGSGKTCLVKEFARRLVSDPLPSSMKRPHLFLLNAAQIDGSAYSSYVEKLNVIKEQFEGYEKEIILAVDEVHLLDKASIEQLKQWKEEGLRLIFLTNSSEAELKEKWKEAYESLLSHTRSSTIVIQEGERLVLEHILEQQLSFMPHLRLDQEAREWLVNFFEKKEGAPRLLRMAIEAIGAREAAFQNNHEAILRVSQEKSDFERQLQQAAEKGNWQEADKIAHSLKERIEGQQSLLEESAVRRTYLQSMAQRQQTLTHLRTSIASWVHQTSLKKQDRHFLASIEEALSHICVSSPLPFASLWTRQRLEGVIA